MEKCWLWVLSVILLVQIHKLQSCSVEEKMSLLKFKAYLNSNGYVADYLLPSWVEDPRRDCCHWERVTCSNLTRHVTHLSLGYIVEWNGSWPYMAPLNISVFQPFKELRLLNLSTNGIDGWIDQDDDEGSGGMLRLKQLETLDLSRNRFRGSSLRPLSLMTSLKNLNLSYNDMAFPDLTTKLMALTGLELLDLSGNGLVGNIPLYIRELTSLKALSLQRNGLNDSLAGLCELKRLEELDLSFNDFEGIIPPCLYNLTSLRYISLSYNYRIEGSFSFDTFANQSQLEAVMLTCGGDKLKVDVESLNQNPLIQLTMLQLSSCLLNNSNFLRHQHELRFLDLSFNKFNSTFPGWLLENNAELRVVDISNNSFTGQLNLPRTPMRNILWLDVSNNHLDGQLRVDFGNILSTLKGFILFNNQLEGDLPSSVSAMRKLERLDLSGNSFSGEVPKGLFISCIKLRQLSLSHNKFSGDMLSTHFNLSELFWVELGDNLFTGKVPSWIDSLQEGTVLALQNNSFEGQFPCEELLHLGYLDLSHNSISGPLPSCFDPSSLRYLILEGNNFTGSIPNAFFNSFDLRVLNLGDNHLSGSIPDLKFDMPPNLQYLFLGKNHLTGLIPRQLCQLNNISIMDLSSNSFSGPIPPCFYNITFGKLDLSDRYLSYNSFGNALPLRVVGDKRVLLRTYIYHGQTSYTTGNVEIFLGAKNMVRLYKGGPLLSMSGLDLSCNNLTGRIPSQLGMLSSVVMLNLSHNQFVGPIPPSFSNLAAIESLDLSFNSLGGEIPFELNNLNFLSTFNVTHNNLSGKIPFTTGQFSTFDESSYEENPLLCGPPSKKICPTDHVIDTVPPPDEAEGKWFEIDSTVFLASFGATYLVFLLATVTLLFINPLWRRRWFYFTEDCFWSCRFFLSDTIRKLSTKCNG